jgi:hypothetical protein
MDAVSTSHSEVHPNHDEAAQSTERKPVLRPPTELDVEDDVVAGIRPPRTEWQWLLICVNTAKSTIHCSDDTDFGKRLLS